MGCRVGDAVSWEASGVVVLGGWLASCGLDLVVLGASVGNACGSCAVARIVGLMVGCIDEDLGSAEGKCKGVTAFANGTSDGGQGYSPNSLSGCMTLTRELLVLELPDADASNFPLEATGTAAVRTDCRLPPFQA